MPPQSPDLPSGQSDILTVRKRLAELSAEQRTLDAQLADLTRRPSRRHRSAAPGGQITRASSSAEKIVLFRSLFRGREDIFPKRWINSKSGKSGYSPVCANEWKAGLCRKPAIRCGECPNSAFIPVADAIIEQHLRGSDAKDRNFTMGVYPMLPDETCWFLAADFDGDAWRRDASAFLETCQMRNVPASLERSRSGSGGHVWIFFAQPVPAATARRFGTWILAETMERRPEVGFASYDRFFPSQDTLPNGGFGNLIALPLQKRPRQAGHSLFVDEGFLPYADQWEYLSSIRRLTLQEITACLDEAQSPGSFPGVRQPMDEEDDEEPWLIPPSRKKPDLPITDPLPETVDMVLGDQVYIDRSGLPPVLANRLLHMAAFQNPEFYKAQALRLSTFRIPRVIGCAELHSRHIALPRGCLDQAESLLSSLGIRVTISDKRNPGRPIQASFLGELTPQQQAAESALLPHDTGVLAATTAFGKTVVAASVIAARKTNTLVLVHRRQLLDQWAARLQTFLDISSGKVGTIGGGTRKPGGFVDVAIIQSLVRKGEVDDLVSDYGQLVVDECHHLAAVSFEAVARHCKARHVLGLSATVTRKDGRHPVIFMQCGPVRYRADARKQATRRPFIHRVDLRHTGFVPPLEMADEQPPIQQIYAALTRSKQRNDMIFNDVLSALEAKRSPLVLTERRDHALHLAERLAPFAHNVIVLHGGMGVKARRTAMRKLEGVRDREERLLIATGRYIGEGFDDARLDTLFLTMPISWRGTLAQYAGRLHRIHPGKHEVAIYDYVDDSIPVLARMSGKRVKGYASLGYSVNDLQAS